VLRANFPDQQGLANMYKQYLNSNDYVFGALSDKQIADLLPGTKIASFASLAGIQSGASNLRSNGIAVIGYDLEKALSPASDMSNPLTAIKSASNIAHQNGLTFMLLAGFPFVDATDASKFAPYVDIYNIQAQGSEKSPTRYQMIVSGISDAVKAANPKAIVITQVALTQGTVNDMEQSFSLVAKDVNGILVHYGLTPDQLPMLNQFYNWFQQNYR
jgi:hypothetical protein